MATAPSTAPWSGRHSTGSTDRWPWASCTACCAPAATSDWSGSRATSWWTGWRSWCAWSTATSAATRPGTRTAARRRAFEATSLFGPLQPSVYPFAHEADRETALARVASTSFVGTLSAAERETVLRRVADLLDNHPATRGRETLGLPYRADVYVSRRLD